MKSENGPAVDECLIIFTFSFQIVSVENSISKVSASISTFTKYDIFISLMDDKRTHHAVHWLMFSQNYVLLNFTLKR